MNVLLVAPTSREARAIGREVHACGAGSMAPQTVARLLDDTRPAVIVLAGVCGGLDPSLSPGDLVLACRLIAPGRPEIAPETSLLDTVRGALRRSAWPFVTAPLVSVERPLASRADKTDTWNATGAAGVDMETYAVAAAAQERGIAWIALRAVLDPAGTALPRSLRFWTPEGEPWLIAAAAIRPWEWPGYARLALAWRAATRSLRLALPAVAQAAARACPPGAAPVRPATLAR